MVFSALFENGHQSGEGGKEYFRDPWSHQFFPREMWNAFFFLVISIVAVNRDFPKLFSWNEK